MKEYQVNNLKIKYSKMNSAWQVKTPTGKIWDEFTHLNSAKAYAKRTTDFIVGSKRKSKRK